jgi:hypothetical protein
MPRHYLNYIRFENNTDQELELNLTQPEEYLRNLIERFIYKSYGVQVHRGFYCLYFTTRDNTVSWIDPSRSINESFTHARRRLNGKAVVHLSVIPSQVCMKLEIKSEVCF